MGECSTRLDRLPVSRFHLNLWLIGGLGFLFEAMDVAIVAFILPAIRVEWELSNQTVGLLAGAASIGGMVGAVLGGSLGDRYGRKKVMLLALAIYTLATLACATADSWVQFLVWRIVAGAGTAAEAIIIAPFLIEFAPPAVRGRFMGSLGAFIALGYLCAAVLGYLIVPSSPDGWRYALVVAALPIFALLWWRRSLPESPRWLEAKGRFAEARVIVEKIEADIARTKELPPVRPSEVQGVPEFSGARANHLFRSSLLPRTMSAVTLFFAIGFGHYAFFSWMPTLLVDRGFSVSSSFSYSLAIYGAQLPGYLTAAWLNDIIGGRKTIVGYMLASAAASLTLALVESDRAVLFGSILLSFSMNGVLAGVYAFIPMLFPTGIRATALGIAGIATRCAAMLSPILIGMTLSFIGFSGIFIAIGLVLVTGALPLYLLNVEHSPSIHK